MEQTELNVNENKPLAVNEKLEFLLQRDSLVGIIIFF